MLPAQSIDGSTDAIAAELRSLIGTLRRRLREQADTGDLTASQTAAWLRLERDGPMTVSALARAEGVRPQSMGTTVTALLHGGLVERTPDPNDGRQSVLSISAAARDKVNAGRAVRQSWLARRIEQELDAEEQDVLARAVTLLRRIADS